jgi:transcriptional regulator with XRE-family HTH domain
MSVAIRRMIGGNVRRLRLDRRLSQRALGTLARMPRGMVSRVECAVENVSIDTIDRLAIGLRVPIAVLLTEAAIPDDPSTEPTAAVA